jgi:hypothetical protein
MQNVGNLMRKSRNETARGLYMQFNLEAVKLIIYTAIVDNSIPCSHSSLAVHVIIKSVVMVIKKFNAVCTIIESQSVPS